MKSTQKLKKPLKVEIDYELLQRIAEYYEFPTAVFLLPDAKSFKLKTRREAQRNKALTFERKLRDLVGEHYGDGY